MILRQDYLRAFFQTNNSAVMPIVRSQQTVVHGNASATANNIAAHETLFPLGIVGDLFCGTILIYRSNEDPAWTRQVECLPIYNSKRSDINIAY